MAVGADFSPGTILEAYRRCIFPWPKPNGFVPWVSPSPRAMFPLDAPKPQMVRAETPSLLSVYQRD
jgi:Leu/Phe-tRNA-protein transferase